MEGVGGGRGPGVGGSDLTETHVLPHRGRRVHVDASIVHAVHSLLDVLIELVELYKNVQQRAL